MNVRAWLRPSPWLLLVLGGALCCTRLENGSDTFAAQSAAGATSSAGVGGGVISAAAGQTASGGAPTDTREEGGAPSVAGSAGAGELAGAAGGDADCVDEAGFEGRGCYRCPPQDLSTLEDACTDATCTWFDNELRLPDLVGGELPELAEPAAVGGTGGGGNGGGSGGGGGGAGGSGGGGLACDSLAASGTLVYVTGSSAVKPFLATIAQQLSPQKVFVVYTSVGSCTGVDAIVNGTVMRTGASPLPASATYWEANTAKSCQLPASGVSADLGISDVFVPSCPGFELINLESLKVRDAHGPIQTMGFAVPTSSKYHQISQQAAYLVFGLGAAARVLDPAGEQPIWNDEAMLLQRSPSSGTQAMLGAAIGVPPSRWKGKPNKTSDDVAAALRAALSSEAAADASLGILSADTIDSQNLRAELRLLAYQDSHQSCAFLPDSTETSNDKRNVRDGHYPIWGPLHLLYKMNAAGEPLNAAIRAPLLDIVGYLSGSKPLPNKLSLIAVYAKSGLVPECAMRVTRSADGGPITPARPESPCSCAFEEALGSTSCKACKVQGDCSAGQSCSRGYCEEP